MYTIYFLYYPHDPATGYVGLTKNLRKRLHAHLNNAPYLTAPIKDKWILKYGRDLHHTILETGLSLQEAQERERFWIALLKQQGLRLKNGTAGGEGVERKATPAEIEQNRINQTKSAYVVVKDGQVEHVQQMRVWAFQRGYNPSHFYDVANGRIEHAYGFLCFTEASWHQMTAEEQQLHLGKTNIKRGSYGHNKKPYLLFDGQQWIQYSSMKELCADRGLSQTSAMRHLGKDWKGIRIIAGETIPCEAPATGNV